MILRRYFSTFFLGFYLIFASANLRAQSQPIIHVITVDGIVNPVSAEFIETSINDATEAGAEALVIQLDTPGGLMTSMRKIVKAELSSEVPVIMFVYPSGAQDASAGVFISYAAHIFAMAPGTNVGAAHPVTLGGGTPGGGTPDSTQSETMNEKVTNDAVAYIKSIAQKRGRNVEWAEDAVRKSVSITETEALDLGVIDYIAPTLDSILAQVNGDTVEVPSGEKILNTSNPQIVEKEMSFRYRILDILSHPNVAYILMMLGFYGLFFELSNPGAIFPGVIGALCLILAFFAFQVLPINYAGVALILLALILFIAEIKITSYGLLTVGGIVSMIIGSIMLFETAQPVFRVSWSVILVVVACTVLFFVFAVGMALRAQKSKPTTGVEGLVGEIGTADTPIYHSGTVSVHGETWSAFSDNLIPEDAKVKVVEVHQMKIKVEEYSGR